MYSAIAGTVIAQPIRITTSDSVALADCQIVSRSMTTYGYRLYASPMPPSVNTVTTRANGSQHRLPSTWRERSTASVPNRQIALISGIADSAISCGNANQRSNTVRLTQGVASEISSTPSATGPQAC